MQLRLATSVLTFATALMLEGCGGDTPAAPQKNAGSLQEAFPAAAKQIGAPDELKPLAGTAMDGVPAGLKPFAGAPTPTDGDAPPARAVGELKAMGEGPQAAAAGIPSDLKAFPTEPTAASMAAGADPAGLDDARTDQDASEPEAPAEDPDAPDAPPDEPPAD